MSIDVLGPLAIAEPPPILGLPAGDPRVMAEVRAWNAKRRMERMRERLEPRAVVLEPPIAPNRKDFPFVASCTFRGIPIDIEQRKGDVREGVDRDGTPWRVEMQAHYGEFRSHVRGATGTAGAKGLDGDRLDVYVGPDADSDLVVIVDQLVPETGAMDEQKAMIGFSSVEDAIACYRKQYTKLGFLGPHIAMTVDEFKTKIADKANAGKALTRALNMLVRRDALMKATRSHKYIARHPCPRGGYWYEYPHPKSGARMVHHRDGDHLPIRSTHRVADVPELAGALAGDNAWSAETRMPSMRTLSDAEAHAMAARYAASDVKPHSVKAMGREMVQHVPSLESLRGQANAGTAAANIKESAEIALIALDVPEDSVMRLCGIPDNTQDVTVVASDDGSVRIGGGHPTDGPVSIVRRVSASGRHMLIVENVAYEAGSAGSGSGARNLLTQALEARALVQAGHYDRVIITASAMGTPDQRAIASGYMAWLVCGFRSSQGLRGPHGEPIEQLAHSPEGRAWWLVKGHGFEAYFDPTDDYCAAALAAEVSRAELRKAAFSVQRRMNSARICSTVKPSIHEGGMASSGTIVMCSQPGLLSLRPRSMGTSSANHGAPQATSQDRVKREEIEMHLNKAFRDPDGSWWIPTTIALGAIGHLGELWKGSGQRYWKKVPTGNPRHPWRYYYRATAGGGIANQAHMQQGAAFKGTHNGQMGHFHVKQIHNDGHVTIHHDESGVTEKVHRDELQRRLEAEHSKAIEVEHKGKANRLDQQHAEAVKHGSPVQAAKLRADADKAHVAASAARKQGRVAEAAKAPPKPQEPAKQAQTAAKVEPQATEVKSTPKAEAKPAHEDGFRNVTPQGPRLTPEQAEHEANANVMGAVGRYRAADDGTAQAYHFDKEFTSHSQGPYSHVTYTPSSKKGHGTVHVHRREDRGGTVRVHENVPHSAFHAIVEGGRAHGPKFGQNPDWKAVTDLERQHPDVDAPARKVRMEAAEDRRRAEARVRREGGRKSLRDEDGWKALTEAPTLMKALAMLGRTRHRATIVG